MTKMQAIQAVKKAAGGKLFGAVIDTKTSERYLLSNFTVSLGSDDTDKVYVLMHNTRGDFFTISAEEFVKRFKA